MAYRTIPEEIRRQRLSLRVLELMDGEPAEVAGLRAMLAHLEDRYQVLSEKVQQLVDLMADTEEDG